jgi:hypothetical protein
VKDAHRALAALGVAWAALWMAAPAEANVPSPIYSTCDSCLVIAPGHSFLYRVILRDDANAPVANASVAIDFNGVTGVNLCPGQDPDFDGRVVGMTDGSGVVDFYIRGGGYSYTLATVSSVATTLCYTRVRSPDLNGDLLVDATDQTTHQGLGSGSLIGDFDCDNDTDAADLSELTDRLGENCATVQNGSATWGRIKALYR